MSGVEIAAGAAIAWLWVKLRRVGGRVDAVVNDATDVAVDRLHRLVSDKLGDDSALADLADEARRGDDANEITKQRVRLSIQAALTADTDFAQQLQDMLAELQRLQPGAVSTMTAGRDITSAVDNRGAQVTGPVHNSTVKQVKKKTSVSIGRLNLGLGPLVAIVAMLLLVTGSVTYVAVDASSDDETGGGIDRDTSLVTARTAGYVFLEAIYIDRDLERAAAAQCQHYTGSTPAELMAMRTDGAAEGGQYRHIAIEPATDSKFVTDGTITSVDMEVSAIDQDYDGHTIATLKVEASDDGGIYCVFNAHPVNDTDHSVILEDSVTQRQVGHRFLNAIFLERDLERAHTVQCDTYAGSTPNDLLAIADDYESQWGPLRWTFELDSESTAESADEYTIVLTGRHEGIQVRVHLTLRVTPVDDSYCVSGVEVSD